MCKCTPNKRTPYCGAPGCGWPPQRSLNELIELTAEQDARAKEIKEDCRQLPLWAARTIVSLRDRVADLQQYHDWVAPQIKHNKRLCTSGCHGHICAAFVEQDDGDGRVSDYCATCGHTGECHEPIPSDWQPIETAPKDLVPGVMRCAKCEFQLVRTNLYVNSGTFGPGDSKTEPCPNGCGPLWPVTWRQWAEEAQKTAERFFDEAKAERANLAAMATLIEKAPARIVRAVCELPDYTSPEDQPDVIMCTVDELHAIVVQALSEPLPAVPTQQETDHV